MFHAGQIFLNKTYTVAELEIKYHLDLRGKIMIIF